MDDAAPPGLPVVSEIHILHDDLRTGEGDRPPSPGESGAAKRALTTPTSDTRRLEASQAHRVPGAAPSSSRPSPRSRAAFGEWARTPEPVEGCACCDLDSCCGCEASTNTSAGVVPPPTVDAESDGVEYELTGGEPTCDACQAGGRGVEDDAACTCSDRAWIVHLLARPSNFGHARAAQVQATPFTDDRRQETAVNARYRPCQRGLNNTQGRRQGHVMVPGDAGIAGNLASNQSRGQGDLGVRSRKGRSLPPDWRIILQPNGKTKGGEPKFKEAYLRPDGTWVRGGWAAVEKILAAMGAAVPVVPSPAPSSAQPRSYYHRPPGSFGVPPPSSQPPARTAAASRRLPPSLAHSSVARYERMLAGQKVYRDKKRDEGWMRAAAVRGMGLVTVQAEKILELVACRPCRTNEGVQGQVQDHILHHLWPGWHGQNVVQM